MILTSLSRSGDSAVWSGSVRGRGGALLPEYGWQAEVVDLPMITTPRDSGSCSCRYGDFHGMCRTNFPISGKNHCTRAPGLGIAARGYAPSQVLVSHVCIWRGG
jgi:hypothetical protein